MFVIVFFIGLIPAIIASGKGKSFFLWWIYGMAIFIVALPHSLIIKPNQKVLTDKALSNGEFKNVHFAQN